MNNLIPFKFQKIAINMFIVTSIFFTIWFNLQIKLSKILLEEVQNTKSNLSRLQSMLNRSDLILNSAGRFLGLNNSWRMFSRLERSKTKIQIFGITANGAKILLPLPLQNKAGFVQKNVLEFREAKFIENLAKFERLRRSYANYLCRQFSNIQPPIKSILIQKHSEPISFPSIVKNQQYLQPVQIKQLKQIKCQS